MDERAFINLKQDSWREFSDLLDRLGSRGPRALTRDELKSFGRRYRAVLADLSYARSRGAAEDLVGYLNDLAGRAHGILYSASPARLRKATSFIVSDFPSAFRSSLRYFIVAAAVFAVGAFVGVEMVGAGFDAGEWGPPADLDPAGLSSYIMTNNIKVTILAFAAGMTAGLLTLWILLFNGAFLATVAASQKPPQSIELWTFVLPHGVIELTAIFTAGGAGLMIGWAMVVPGTMRRIDAVRLAAARGLILFAGAAVLLVIAGVIEGFVSPSPMPRWSKILFSAAVASALALYLGLAGRPKEVRGS